MAVRWSSMQKGRQLRPGLVIDAPLWIAVLLILLAGCQPKEPLQDSGRSAPLAKPNSATSDHSPSRIQDTGPGAPVAVREKAGVGVGEKGRGYGGGLVTTSVAAYFAIRERLVFDVQIPQAMSLYKATEGHAPKTQDEFMQKIITANQIRLPALPEGHRYVYDPKTEQLMVERPQ